MGVDCIEKKANKLVASSLAIDEYDEYWFWLIFVISPLGYTFMVDCANTFLYSRYFDILFTYFRQNL